MVAGAVMIGLGLNHVTQGHLATLEVLAAVDPIAARRQLAIEIRLGGLGLFALLCGLGVSLVPASLRAAREERFPPRGLWGWGATRIMTGPAARRAANVGVVLGVFLAACSIAGGWLSWEMGARLLACRAGVPPESS
jgi:hypothetical protein